MLLAEDVSRWAVVRGSPNPLHYNLAERLRKTREAADVKHTSLSLAAGLARNTVLYIEKDGRVPGVDVIEKLARVLKVSPCALAFGLEGEPTPSQVDAPLACDRLGARLAEVRTKLGLTRKALGRVAHSTDTTVRLTEEGETKPLVSTVEDLAKALGISPCWLAFGEGPQERPTKTRRKPAKKAPPAARRARLPAKS